MVLVGSAITPNDVVADPRYCHLKPEQVTTKLLSSYTLEQKVKYEFKATEIMNGIKDEWGNGTCGLIRIYNASGHTLTFQEQGPNWSGHVWKYPFDNVILNGQWSVVLHVKTTGIPRGSVSCFVYTIEDEGADVFCGWSVPNTWYSFFYSNTAYTWIQGNGCWPANQSWDHMYDLVSNSGMKSYSTWNGKTATVMCSAQTGDVSSPMINFTLTAK